MTEFSMNTGVPAPSRALDVQGFDNVTQYTDLNLNKKTVPTDPPTPLVEASVPTSNTQRVQIGRTAHDIGGV